MTDKNNFSPHYNNKQKHQSSRVMDHSDSLLRFDCQRRRGANAYESRTIIDESLRGKESTAYLLDQSRDDMLIRENDKLAIKNLG